jgi:Chaperone of endosialidase
MKATIRSLAIITLTLLGFGLLPKTQAVVPPPDGGYPNFTTAEGTNALKNLTTGAGNTGMGWFSLSANSSGNYNTGTGAGTLALNNADQNTAIGTAALLLNTDGARNTAIGVTALLNNDDGGDNTAIGAGALFSNIAGSSNTATGAGALRINTTGTGNTATGVRALFINNADNNTATGFTALLNNTDGVGNTATGYQALLANTTGVENTAVGADALASNDAGCCNTAVGFGALSDATSIGDCIALGAFAGSNVIDAFNVIAIGHSGADVSDTTWIDNIYGVTTQSGTTLPVVVSNQGQLGTAGSSVRFKQEIRPMEKASEAIHALKPVTFQYKSDRTNTPQFGLIAEEVAGVNPDLVVRDADGEIYAVRYEAVNAMLLNEFLKEHRKVEDLEKQVAALTAGLQKLSAAVELNKAAPTQVADNR